MDWFTDHYLAGAPVDAGDPRVSPLRAADLSGLAPAHRRHRRRSTRCATRARPTPRALREAGAPVALRRFDGLIHGFINMVGISRVSRDALIEIAGATRALLGHAR